jgi:hypothetical protein
MNILRYHPASVRRILYVGIENENVSGLDLPRAGNDAQQRRLSDSIGPDEPNQQLNERPSEHAQNCYGGDRNGEGCEPVPPVQ